MERETTWEKYTDAAASWTRDGYADSHAYLKHRAELVLELGRSVQDGSTVLDLACGDAAFAAYLPAQNYLGVDANESMIEAARRAGRNAVLGDLNEFRPDAPVAVTTIFRAIYYARDRRRLFEHVASYTTDKLVFDLNPRQFPLEDVAEDLRGAGFGHVAIRPFFVPQTRALWPPAREALIALEQVRPLASLLLRRRFTLLCAALR